MTIIAPEFLADLRKKATAASCLDPTDFYPGQAPSVLQAHRDAASPAVVLALLDRLEALERSMAEAFSALGHSYKQREAGLDFGWTRPHRNKCGCVSCRKEYPKRFAAPDDS